MDGIEGVEELFLCAFFAREELDVVDQEHVDAAIPLAELLALLAADRVDELVRELLARRVRDALLRVSGDHGVSDRVDQMVLSKAGSPGDKRRVVRLARGVRDGDRGR